MTNVKITHKQATLKPVGPMMRVFSSGRLSRIGGIALFVGKQKNAFLPVSTWFRVTFAVKRPDHTMSAAGTIQLSLEDKVLLLTLLIIAVLYLVQTSLFDSNLNVCQSWYNIEILWQGSVLWTSLPSFGQKQEIVKMWKRTKRRRIWNVNEGGERRKFRLSGKSPLHKRQISNSSSLMFLY